MNNKPPNQHSQGDSGYYQNISNSLQTASIAAKYLDESKNAK
jgi:hypothetical protein